jgi:putative tributyrin esterase
MIGSLRMKLALYPRWIKVSCCVVLFLLAACNVKKEEAQPDHPQLTANVTLRDVTFHSRALDRDMVYRVILPVNAGVGQKLPVVYLLHGGGGGYRDWSNHSDVASYAERGLILVMPEGNSSYYTNSAGNPRDRYEDYIVNDIIADVEGKFPAAVGRENRAIAGVSMGGYGAVKIALRFPGVFVFAAGISPALDVPSRPFSIKRPLQWKFHSSIFGPTGSQTRHDNDPYVLARTADPVKTPYLFLSCGEQEGLLAANKRFAARLAERKFSFEFHTANGDHNWNQWDQRIPEMFQSLQRNPQFRNLGGQ